MSTKDKRISFEEKGKYPFFTPEGYFDDLTARIMKQIPEADTAISSSKVIGINGTRNTESAEDTRKPHTNAQKWQLVEKHHINCCISDSYSHGGRKTYSHARRPKTRKSGTHTLCQHRRIQ